MKKIKNLLTTLIGSGVIFFNTKVYADGGSGDPGTAIDTWGNTAIGLFLKAFKYGGIIALISIGFFLFFNNDEANAKRGKYAFFIVLAACFVGWFAQPIYNAFVK